MQDQWSYFLYKHARNLYRPCLGGVHAVYMNGGGMGGGCRGGGSDGASYCKPKKIPEP